MLDKLEKWKEKLNDLDKNRIKAEGRLEQALESLKALGYNSVDKAEDHLEQLKEDYEKATEEAEDLIKILEEKYGKYLSEES